MDDSFPDYFTQILVDEERRNRIAIDNVMQSMFPSWFSERETRMSASTTAHRIKIRKSDFESLARSLFMQTFSSAVHAHMV